MWLGVDIGGTRTRAALVTADGGIVARAAGATGAAGAPDAIVAGVARLVAQVMRGVDRAAVAAVGVCAPGPLDASAGLALATPTIGGLRDYPLRDQIAAAIGMDCRLEHDGQAAAFGEWRFGAGRGCEALVFVTISTGIGGGAVVDGRLQRGRRGMAAHVGHMVIWPDGPLCNCGNRGCWEALAAGPALNLAARAAGFVDGAAVFEGARAGDTRAVAVAAEEARWLGIGIVNLLHIYSSEVVVLGGGVVAGLDVMRAGIEAHVAAHAMGPFRGVAVRAAELGDNAGVIGAAVLAGM